MKINRVPTHKFTHFAWDPAKRKRNIEKHGIDFRRATQIFDRSALIQPSPRDDEMRWLATGPIAGAIITVVYTIRGDDATICRIISAR